MGVTLRPWRAFISGPECAGARPYSSERTPPAHSYATPVALFKR